MSWDRADAIQKSSRVSFLSVCESCRRKDSQVGDENDLMVCEEGEYPFPTIQLLLSFQLVFVWSVRGFEGEPTIAVHSPQCHNSQHVITIALSTCNLLAQPLLDGERMPTWAGAVWGNVYPSCFAAGAGTGRRPGGAVADMTAAIPVSG